MYCVISIELMLEQNCISVYMYVGMELGQWCTVSHLGGWGGGGAKYY